MTDIEKYQYDSLKAVYTDTVLLFRITTGQWVARGADIECVLAILPQVTIAQDCATIEQKDVARLLKCLKAAGHCAAKAELIAKAQENVAIERIKCDWMNNPFCMVYPAQEEPCT